MTREELDDFDYNTRGLRLEIEDTMDNLEANIMKMVYRKISIDKETIALGIQVMLDRVGQLKSELNKVSEKE